jgi:hypothetical protein
MRLSQFLYSVWDEGLPVSALQNALPSDTGGNVLLFSKSAATESVPLSGFGNGIEADCRTEECKRRCLRKVKKIGDILK